MEDAKGFCESLYKLENAREKFDFPIQHIARLPRGKQEVTLPCPILGGIPRHGWLSINWSSKSARVHWDYGDFDARYPECDRFKLILEQSNWDRELIRRMIEAGWNWQRIDRTSMRWNHLRGVPHEIAQHYANYGGRGIAIEDERRFKFKHFLDDMGECPDDLTLERLNNSIGYRKDNCEWKTRTAQSRNTCQNRIVKYQGQKMCLMEATQLAGGEIHHCSRSNAEMEVLFRAIFSPSSHKPLLLFW